MLYYPLVTKILFGFVFLPLVIESDFRNACRRTAYNTPISSSSFNNVIVHGSNGSGIQTIVRSSYLPQQMLQRFAQCKCSNRAKFTPQSNRRRGFNSVATDLVERSAAKRKPGTKTWTVGFICFANNLATRTPTATQKQILFKAGLVVKENNTRPGR